MLKQIVNTIIVGGLGYCFGAAGTLILLICMLWPMASDIPSGLYIFGGNAGGIFFAFVAIYEYNNKDNQC